MHDSAARTVGLVVAAVGVAAQVAGLGADAWLEAGTAGPALIVGGSALVLGGIVTALARPTLLGVAAPVVLLAAVAGGTLAAAGSGPPGGEVTATPALSPEDRDPEDLAVEAIAETLTSDEASHGHGDGHAAVPNQPLDRVTRDQLAAELVAARETALRYPTVADAERDGYRMITPYVPLIGAHYINFRHMDQRFDLAAPEMLLYDGTDPASGIVGLSYYQFAAATEPDGFAGPNDHWHQHQGLCINNSLLVVGGEQISEDECRRRGGRKIRGTNGWMVHAWVVPGWESPAGVFSAEHPDLR